MPAPVSNTICGPTVPGTEKPPAGMDLALLNQCPLNVCCNIWGQCGTADEFCIKSEFESGAPGTAAPGENIDTDQYTHVHSRFLISCRSSILMQTSSKNSLASSGECPESKKIVSLCGWDLSALPSAFHILREAVEPRNRDAFQSNLVAFVEEHNLDGVDID